jgi:uncharacterized phosphosugar-binding protein
LSQKYAQSYFDVIRSILDEVETTQNSTLLKAARVTAESLIKGGIIHVFGTGHSHMLAEEAFFRAGGLAQVNAILDPSLMLHVSAFGSTYVERLEGYAPIVLQRYDLKPDDILVLVSNSGRNACSIDAAFYAKEHGLIVIALTSARAYQNVEVRHSSGMHLSKIADIVIDTCTPKGDAAISLEGLSEPVGGTSTVIGAALLQAYIIETVKEILARDCQPKIIISSNLDVRQDYFALIANFADRIRHR